MTKPYSQYTKDELMRLLESLTPGGSEYYEEPETCVERIRDYQRSIKHHMVKRKEVEKQRDALLVACEAARNWLGPIDETEWGDYYIALRDLKAQLDTAIAAAKGI